MRAEGKSLREIASRVGVCEKAIRKQLHRLGWRAAKVEQIALPLGPAPADPKVSATAASPVQAPPASSAAPADLNLSAPAPLPDDEEPLPICFDRDPADRSIDRLFAHLGLLDDAAPLFRDGTLVPRAGVLLAIPAILQSGVIAVAREVYGSIGPAFYGLRTTVVALLFMALLRIKRPEALKEHSPSELGRLLGLDRAPEVKTIRRKLARLSAFGRATKFGQKLALLRVREHEGAMGFLYLDGHVRVYHGKRPLPQAHVTRMRISMTATTDYWINDTEGEPLLVLTAEANSGLARMLPALCDEIRALVGERRVTIVFDRGGWSPKLFATLIGQGFDILTYRKGPSRSVDGQVVKLATERKHLTDVLKMVAYQVENDLVRHISPHYRRTQDEGHTLVESILAAAGDIHVSGSEIRLTLAPLSSPHKTRALAALCADLDSLAPRFPGSRLRLRYAVAASEPGKADTFDGG